jgi:hypothetical protein
MHKVLNERNFLSYAQTLDGKGRLELIEKMSEAMKLLSQASDLSIKLNSKLIRSGVEKTQLSIGHVNAVNLKIIELMGKYNTTTDELRKKIAEHYSKERN